MAEQLKPYEFKKGQSGNPNGRPRILPELKEVMERLLSENITDNKSGKEIQILEAVLRTLQAKALKGDMRAIQELLDRFYGKPKQYTDVTTNGENISTQFPTIEQFYGRNKSEVGESDE